MKKVLLLLAAISLPSAANASLKIETAWDKNCTKPGSMAIKATNNYSYPIDMRLCLQRTDKTWACFVSPNVEPGQIAPRSWGYYVCKASGEYFWSVRRAGAWSVKFDDPPGYRKSNTTRTSRRPGKGSSPDIKTTWDTVAKGTMSITALNQYTYTADMRLCLKSKNERWTCWVQRNVAPGRRAGLGKKFYVYGATGDYFWSARRAGATSVKFDDPPDYKRE